MTITLYEVGGNKPLNCKENEQDKIKLKFNKLKIRPFGNKSKVVWTGKFSAGVKPGLKDICFMGHKLLPPCIKQNTRISQANLVVFGGFKGFSKLYVHGCCFHVSFLVFKNLYTLHLH